MMMIVMAMMMRTVASASPHPPNDDDDHDHDEDERCLWTDAVSEATGGHRANTLHFHHCSLSSPSIVYMFYVTSNLAIKDFLHLLPLRFQ